MKITKIHFSHYKAFEDFTIELSNFDVLVGPNNSGKSTILGAFRLLSEGLRKANSRSSEWFQGSSGRTRGYLLDLQDSPISLENVFHNYEEGAPAIITFYLDNGKSLSLFFPDRGICYLVPERAGIVRLPSEFKESFPLDIKFVPVLGPVEHEEEVYQKEAARRSLLTHRASRNFRNIWYHYPEGFIQFREMIRSSWPGMDIEPPELISETNKNTLVMFCPEDRIPREIYWAGFGFQVWCQMLTFILQAKKSSLLIIDEPDIYLHSDLQRQLVSILRDLNVQILIATHSVEIISEVDSESLLTIHKSRKKATRIVNPRDLQTIYKTLGTNANPVLTQLAKTRRVLFLEGKDFQIISLFARKLRKNNIANRSDFAEISVEGFNPQKVRDFSKGIEVTLGIPILKGVIFDRDYRSDDEALYLTKELKGSCFFVEVLKRKEIENFMLKPKVLDKAINADMRLRGIVKKHGEIRIRSSEDVLNEIAESLRTEIIANYLACRRLFKKKNDRALADSTIDTPSLKEFEDEWSTFDGKMKLVPGKEMLSKFNSHLQVEYGISLTIRKIIDQFTDKDMDEELINLIALLEKFSQKEPNR